ncbi:hypothetical protein CF392_15260, partial [Tamilnaduibacter salinus]
NRINTDPASGNDTSDDLYDTDTPVVGSSDDLIEVLYSLIGPEFDRLAPIDGGQDLILAVGEEETRIERGEDNTLRVDNLDHLAGLAPEDYLSMRLYLNQDAGNVLWEYAFNTIEVFPPYDSNGPVQISADHAAETTFSAILYGAEEPVKSLLNWGASPNVSVPSSVASQRSEDGFYTATVNLPTQAGEKSYLTASVGSSPSAGTQTVVFETVPGQTHAISTVSQTGKTAFSGFGEVNLTLELKDKYGNKVSDGTPVEFEASGLRVTGDTQTNEGRVSLAVRGGNETGTQDLVVRSGQGEKTIPIEVHDIQFAIEAPDTIQTGESATATVTANSSYGSLNGLPLNIGLVRGRTDEQSITLSGGQAQFEFSVGNIRGDGQAMVAVGDRMAVEDFSVIDPPGTPYLLDTLLMADASAPGSMTIQGETHQYTNGTSVVVPGTPGETIELSLVDYLKPPVLPTASYSMQKAPQSGSVKDEMLAIEATAEGVSVIPNAAFKNYKRAYRFDGDSSLAISHSEIGGMAESGFTFHFKPQSVGGASSAQAEALIAQPGLGLTLTLENGRLVWSQTMSGTSASIESAPLTADRFYAVGAHWVKGQLVLQVGDTVYKSDGVPTASSNSNDELVIGQGFKGLMAGFKAFDWSDEKLVSFASGGLEASSQVDASGHAVVSFNANAGAYAALSRKRSQLIADAKSNGLIPPAFADQACTPPSYDDADAFGFEYGEIPAFFGTLAECDVLPRLNEAVITVTDKDENNWSRAFALMETATYASAYTALKAHEYGSAYAPACTEGAITGSADSLAKGTCDFITSLLLVGDLRDFAKHGYFLYADSEDDAGNPKFDEPIFVFATLGIVLNVAPPVDAAVAGCKTAAKVMKGSDYIAGLASVVKGKTWDHLDEPSKLATSLKPVLPLMQTTALIHYYGDDMQEAVVVLRNIDQAQVEGWLAYMRALVGDAADEIALNGNQSNWLKGFLPEAHAAVKDPLGIVKYLDETGKLTPFLEAVQTVMRKQDGLMRVDGQSYVGQAISGSVAQLGKSFDELGSAELQSKVSDWRVLMGFVTAFDVAKGNTRLMEALARFPCVPSNCALGGISKRADIPWGPDKIAEFFDLIGELSELRAAGRITDKAYDDLAEVIDQLGRVQGNGKVNFNMAKGASEVIALAVKEGRKGNTVTGFEIKEVIENGANTSIGERFFDLVLKVDGKTLRVESKAWRPDVVKTRLLESLRGKVEGGFQGGKGGQLRKDLVDSVRKYIHGGPDAIDIRWRFDDRVDQTEVDKAIKAIVKELNSNDVKAGFFRHMNETRFVKRKGQLITDEVDTFLDPDNDKGIIVVVEKMFLSD